MITYKLIEQTSVVEFNKLLNEYIEQGWYPAGNHFVVLKGDYLFYSILLKKV